MASTKKHKKLVRLKLDTLEQQRTLVHDAVDKYVNKVAKEVKGWLDNTGGQRLTSKNLTQLIDNAVEFLVEKETEISDEDEEEKHGETSDTGVPGTLKSQTPILPVTLGHAADGEDVPLSMTSAVDSSTTTDMKEVLARLDALEKTVSSVHERADNQNSKQGQGEENLENLSAKQAEMEGKLVQIMIEQSDHSENIENIFSLLSSMENNQQIRVKKLRTKIDDITKSQGKARKLQEVMIEDLKKRMDSLSETVEQDLGKQMKTLSRKVGEISEEISSKSELETDKGEDFKEQLMSVQKTVAEMKEEISVSDKKLGDQIRDVEHRVSAVSEKATEIDTATGKMFEKVAEIDAATGKMSDQITEIDATTEELSEKMDKIQEKDEAKIEDLKNKVLAVKRRRKKDFKDVETRYKKVELQYKMVCSIVADRLLGLERLRDILNKKILARDQMAKANLPDVGFKASTCCPLYKYKEAVRFDTVETNHGYYFDPWTGMYTVPRDGRYNVSFSADKNCGCLSLYHIKASDKSGNLIICDNDRSMLHNGVKAATCVVTLSSGDSLCLKGDSYDWKTYTNVSTVVNFFVSSVD